MYIEPKKRIVKKLSELLKAVEKACCEYGLGICNWKGSFERNSRSRVQTMQNIINQANIDWDDEYYEEELDENADALCDEIDEIIEDMNLMLNPASWQEVIDEQLDDAESAVKNFTYYN